MTRTARRLDVDITARSLLKIAIAAALVWTWLRLWQWVLLFIVAVFITVGLDPLVAWLDAKGLRRNYASVVVVTVVTVVLIAFCYLAGAELLAQGRLLGERFDQMQQEITRRLPQPLLQLLPKQPMQAVQGGGENGRFAQYAMQLGQAIVNGVLSIALALVLTVYLLIDGRRTYEWLVAFAPRARRPKLRQTALAAREAVVGYVRGNIVTSVIAGVSAYVFLRILGVPAALLLALLTALFDLLPVLGIFLTVVPMVLLALTVSVTAAIAVVIFNAVYNLVENYYISPKVYGRQMQLSSLAIILAFAVGAELGGVIGALIALPFAAVYPAVENIWLADRLGPDVVDDHRRIEQSEEH